MIQKATKRKLISVRLVSLGNLSKVKNSSNGQFQVFNKQNITLRGLHVHDDARFSVGFLCRCCTTKGYVTRDDSQPRFLAQHSVATLFRIGTILLQHCNAVLCCAKNCLCESFRVITFNPGLRQIVSKVLLFKSMKLELTKYCCAFTSKERNDNTKCYNRQCIGR